MTSDFDTCLGRNWSSNAFRISEACYFQWRILNSGKIYTRSAGRIITLYDMKDLKVHFHVSFLRSLLKDVLHQNEGGNPGRGREGLQYRRHWVPDHCEPCWCGRSSSEGRKLQRTEIIQSLKHLNILRRWESWDVYNQDLPWAKLNNVYYWKSNTVAFSYPQFHFHGISCL